MKKLFLISLFLIPSFFLYGQNIVISNDRMNVAYVGIPNPITVVVEGFKASLVYVSTDNGSLVDNGNGKYDFTPAKQGKASISVSVKIKNGIKEIGTTLYRIKEIPMPVAIVHPRKEDRIMGGGTTDYKSGLMAISSNEDFKITFIIIDYKIRAFRNNTLLKEGDNLGARFNSESQNIIETLKLGDKLVFSDIHCKYPDGSIRKLEDLIIRIHN